MELLKGNVFVYNDGRKTTFEQVLKAKIVLLYFSGIWCPPCKGFLPAIRNFYKEVNKGCTDDNKNVEIIFVSCDTDKEEFDDHIAELPFPGIVFGDLLIEKLEELFDVENIPVVPLIRKDGSIGSENVRRLITDKGPGSYIELAKMNVIT